MGGSIVTRRPCLFRIELKIWGVVFLILEHLCWMYFTAAIGIKTIFVGCHVKLSEFLNNKMFISVAILLGQ